MRKRNRTKREREGIRKQKEEIEQRERGKEGKKDIVKNPARNHSIMVA